MDVEMLLMQEDDITSITSLLTLSNSSSLSSYIYPIHHNGKIDQYYRETIGRLRHQLNTNNMHRKIVSLERELQKDTNNNDNNNNEK